MRGDVVHEQGAKLRLLVDNHDLDAHADFKFWGQSPYLSILLCPRGDDNK
jgi:hypothetical protein